MNNKIRALLLFCCLIPISSFGDNKDFCRAAARGDVDTMRKELKNVKNIDDLVYDDNDEGLGYTALFLACQNGHLDALQFLLDKGANHNALATDGMSPLTIASQRGHTPIVSLLAQYGVDINTPCTEYELTPLGQASQNGHVNMVNYLIKNGSDVNHRDADGCTAVYLASQQGHAAIVPLLIKAKADIHIPNKHSNTPLITASSDGCEVTESGGGYNKIVQTLLEAKAVVNTPGQGHSTALYRACQSGSLSIAKQLLDAKADQSIGDYGNRSPLKIAQKNKHHDIVSLLSNRAQKIQQESKEDEDEDIFLYRRLCDDEN